jgi:hypothetical protein
MNEYQGRNGKSEESMARTSERNVPRPTTPGRLSSRFSRARAYDVARLLFVEPAMPIFISGRLDRPTFDRDEAKLSCPSKYPDEF